MRRECPAIAMTFAFGEERRVDEDVRPSTPYPLLNRWLPEWFGVGSKRRGGTEGTGRETCDAARAERALKAAGYTLLQILRSRRDCQLISNSNVIAAIS